MKLYGVNVEEKRQILLKSDASKPIIDTVIKRADEAIDTEYKALKISDYMLFIQTGDRKVFEREYFKRRNNCSYLLVAYWLTNDEKYKKPLEDLIFFICDEYTWCLPAHAGLENSPASGHTIGAIDLFQSETARLLTDIHVILGEKLSYYVDDRIEYEIRRRIIEPIKVRDYGWFRDTNNWAAVCAGGVGVAVIHYADEAEKSKILPVLDKCMEHYLSGFNDDGCCLEGSAYWNYGFGYFLLYATAVMDYNGVNMFENEKVKQIALYPQRTRMGKSKTVSFSDGGTDFITSPGAVGLLKKMYPDEIVYPPAEYLTYRGNVYSVKELLWFDTDYKADDGKYLTSFFKDSQWYVRQGEKYCFAAKGGHNDEPHNHNDIGSFMIVAGEDDIPLADLGCAIYRKETFDPNLRYTLLNNSSRGHSVPIINGEYQLAGRDYRAENVKAGDDFFELELQGAYRDGLSKKIHRRFDLKENSILLCDTFECFENTITERMVSWTKPVICDGYVDLKSAKVMYDKEKYTATVSKEEYRNHADTEDVTAYLIDFEGIEGEFKVEIVPGEEGMNL